MQVLKRFNRILLIGVICALVSLSGINKVIAQIEGDTLYATAIIVCNNAQNGSPVPHANLQFRPETVQMFNPDTIYNLTTDGNGFALLSVIAYLDSTTSIHENNAMGQVKVFVHDANLHIELPSDIPSGKVSLYELNGQLIQTYKMGRERLSIPMDELAGAAYVYIVQSAEGTASGLATHTGVSKNSHEKTIKSVNDGMEGDTLWATGFLVTQNSETGSNVGVVDLQLTPEEMQMVVPDITYLLRTGGSGIVPYTLPAYIDSTTGVMQQQAIEDAKVYVYQQVLHIELPEEVKEGQLQIYNLNGQQIISQMFSGKKTSISLQDLPNTQYVYALTTPTGRASGSVNNTGANAKRNKNGLKELALYEATYWVKWDKEGFLKDSTLITLEDGDNGFIILQIAPDNSGVIPQWQYIGGTIRDDDGNGISGAYVRVDIDGIQFDHAYTDANGEYMLSTPIPTDTEFEFKAVGGIAGKFSFSGDISSTMDEVLNHDDTLRLVYDYVLPDKQREVPDQPGVFVTPTAFEVREMHLKPQSEYGIRQTILWDQSQEWSESQKQINRNLVQDGMNMFGIQGSYVEVSYELNTGDMSGYDGYNTTLEGEIGLKIRPGSDNTSPFQISIEPTPGNIVNVTLASNITISGNLTSFYKELFGRALAIAETTSRPSYMNSSSGPVNNKDKVIVDMILKSYIDRLDTRTQYFGFESMVEDIE